jgi:hypothetical protein
MLDRERDQSAKNGGGDYHRGNVELQLRVRQQMDVDGVELEVRGYDVDHPGCDQRAPDELGILQKCRQICEPPCPRSWPVCGELSNMACARAAALRRIWRI